MCKSEQKRNAKEHWSRLGHKRCHYCCRTLRQSGKQSGNLATVERIIPGSLGGSYRLENCLVTYYDCNSKRSNKDFKGFVTGSRLPRREWLLSKYEIAKELYR